MKRPDGLIICDNHIRPVKEEDGNLTIHGDVLDDGVTIVQGYITVTKGKVVTHFSTDPHNHINQPGVLKNRYKDEMGNDLITEKLLGTPTEFGFNNTEPLDFCHVACMEEYLAKIKQNKRKTKK